MTATAVGQLTVIGYTAADPNVKFASAVQIVPRPS
jgi:hypothetical protein